MSLLFIWRGFEKAFMSVCESPGDDSREESHEYQRRHLF